MASRAEIFVFVLMPFDKTFEDIYSLGIKDTASRLGLRAERVDEQIFSEKILERIYRQIEAADIVVADMSGQNPNVFYEVGYAHAKRKMCILLTSDAKDIPFDLKDFRHIVYGSSIRDLKEKLAKELTWAQEQLLRVKSSPIRCDLKEASGYGGLEDTKYMAHGTVEFKIDLYNESEDSIDINSIYFYCSKPWTVTQNGNLAPSSNSDIMQYKTRHFLESPVPRLSRAAWAQVSFSTSRILATAYEGDEIRSAYSLSGNLLIRLVTSIGNIDHEFHVDVTINEVEF
jgi:hypothetical protein